MSRRPRRHTFCSVRPARRGSPRGCLVTLFIALNCAGLAGGDQPLDLLADVLLLFAVIRARRPSSRRTAVMMERFSSCPS